MKKWSLFFLLIICSILSFTPDETFASGLDTPRVQETITPTSGYYFDNNADGYIDSIYIKVNTDITGGLTNDHVQEIMESDVITLPAFRDFSVSSYSVVTDGFALIVSENNGHDPATYVRDDDNIKVTKKTLTGGVLIEGGTITVYDKVAPVIHWKRKATHLTDYQVDSISDTLGVKFSEPVKRVTKSIPFYFFCMETGNTYEATLCVVGGANGHPKPDSIVFWVEQINGSQFIKDGDSIWIHEGDRVGDIALNENGDTVNNYQNNKKNIKRELFVERKLIPTDMIPFSVSPLYMDNIDNDNSSIIPDVIVSLLKDQLNFDELNLWNNGNVVKGMLIMVTPDDIKNILPDFILKGYLTLFDAASDQVLQRTRMAWWDEMKSLVFVWNGRNSLNRQVGSGTYLGIIDYEERTPSLLYDKAGPKTSLRLYVAVADSYSDDSCGCGTGTGLAFIPPIGFKISSLMRKRKKWWVALNKWYKAKISYLSKGISSSF